MSYSKYAEPFYGPKGKENQLKNLIYTAHDLCCSCQDPAAHITTLITPDSKNTSYSTQEIKKLQKCLGTTPVGEDGDVVDGLQPGDLEKLFSEDGEEDPEG